MKKDLKRDYTQTCWSCGGGPMVCLGSYYQCRSCGATWNDTPKMGPACLRTVETGDYTSEHRSVIIPERRNYRRRFVNE